MKPTVLITRPAEEALRTAMALAEHGYDFLIDPLLEIAPLPDAAQRVAGAGDAVALLFTSANGVRAFAAATTSRDLPVYAVGRITGDAARAAGFAKVEIARGDVAALTELVSGVLTPDSGALLHIAGEHVAGDLAGQLAAKGFTVHTLALYTAKAATSLSQNTRDTLARGALGAALFFSPRTARTFVSLVRTAGLEAYCRSTVAVCLSSAVAEAAGAVQWRRVATAKPPGDDPAGGSGIGVMVDALLQALPGEGGNSGGGTGERPDMADTDKKTIALPAGDVIQRFGGIRPMAAKLGISFSTVQGWKERGHIPEARHAEIAALAAAHGVSLEGPVVEPVPAAKPTQPTPLRQTAPPPVSDRPPPIPPPLITQVPPPPSGGLGVAGAAFVSIVIVAGAFAGAYYTRDHWLGDIATSPATAPSQPSVDKAVLDAFAARLGKMERDAAVRPAAPGAAVAAPDPKLAESIADLDKRLTELQNALYATRDQAKRDGQAATASLSEVAQAARAGAAEQAKAGAALAQRIETLEKGFDPAAFAAIRNSLNDLTAKLDAVAKRLEAAEKIASSARAEGMAQAALALSVGQIRRAVDQGSPFTAELSASRSLMGGDASLGAPLDQLAPLAASGVATRAALAQSFKPAAASIMHAGRKRDGESGAWQRFVAWLDSLITIRPVGAAQGDSPAARVARAEAMLAGGDLAGAIAQLEGLGSPASDAAKPWLARAKARLAAEQALAALETRAASAVARK